jgi:MFS family permease
MFEVYAMLVIGRLIYGIACGVHCVAAIRYIEETVPFDKVSYYLTIFLTSFSSGKVIVMILAAGMPSDDDYDDLYEDGYWRFILSFPLLMYAALLLGLRYVVKHESLKFLIIKHEHEEARYLVSLVYSDSQDFHEIFEYLRLNIH